MSDITARDIISDIFQAIEDGELHSHLDPYGNDNAVRRIIDGREVFVVVGDGELDDDGDVIFTWTGYAEGADGEVEAMTDTQAGIVDAVREAAQAWLARQS